MAGRSHNCSRGPARPFHLVHDPVGHLIDVDRLDAELLKPLLNVRPAEQQLAADAVIPDPRFLDVTQCPPILECSRAKQPCVGCA